MWLNHLGDLKKDENAFFSKMCFYDLVMGVQYDIYLINFFSEIGVTSSYLKKTKLANQKVIEEIFLHFKMN